MNTDIDQDELYINCTISPDHYPLVYWSYKGQEGTLSISEARAKARAILSAAAIAESEAAIVEGLRAVNPKAKGFGKSVEHENLAAGLLLLVRGFRPQLPDGLEVIYGHNTKQPLLVLDASWYGTKIQFPTDLATAHAMQLLEAAEAGQSDAFFYHFLEEKVGLEAAEASPMIQEFSLFRQRNQLEDLFRGDQP